jgi:hypothetical protein
MQSWFEICKLNNVIHHSSTIKARNVIISADAEGINKSYNKMLRKLGIEENFLTLIKSNYKNPRLSGITSKGKRVYASS